MDMQLVAVMAGGGSNAVVKVDNEDGTDVGTNLTRLFQDNPAFAGLKDISFDLDAGYFFLVDSDGSDSNGILRGNIADLYSGTATPTLTRIFETDGFGEVIPSIEIDTVNQKIYWLDGDLFSGWELRRSNYDGSNNELIGTLDSENMDEIFGIPGGISDFVIDVANNTAYIVSSTAFIDGFGNAFVLQNHIIKVNSLAAGSDSFTILDVGTGDGTDGFMAGRLDPIYGQIMGLDVDHDTGTLYFVTQPISSTDTGNIFSYDPDTDTLTTLWNQPSPASYDSLQDFPTGYMTNIEYDEVADRYYVTTSSNSDDEFDGTPAVNEADSSIYIGDPAGGAPDRFIRIHDSGDLSAPLGMEIDYAPELNVSSAGSTYVEGGAAVDVAQSPSVSDVEQQTLKGAEAAITGGFLAGDTLSFTPSGGISGSYNAGTGVLTLTGSASEADYQTVLDSVTFSAAGDDPTAGGTDTSRTISMRAFDGLVWGDADTATVAVQGVNDAPTAPPAGSVITAEDTASAATAIGASDVDSPSLTYSEKVGFEADHGVVAFNQGAGTYTYTPDANYNGSDSFTILIDDGDGGTAEQIVAVTVTPVNDAPTAPATGSVSTDQDTPSAATAIGASDVDNDTLFYSEKSGFGASNGTVSFDQLNGTYTYAPDSGFAGSDSFTILVSDGHGGTAEQVISVTVDDVNDAPTGVTGTLTANEDATNGTLAGTLTAQDPDSSSFTYQLLNDAGGRFTMDSSGHVFVADGLLLDYEQASAHTIRVRATDDEGASGDFDVQVNVADVHGEDVLGDARNNIFYGGIEADLLNGGDGNDLLVGQGGQDTLKGGNGADTLLGGGGNDILEGGAGNDIFNGGAGADTMRGGGGDDIYIFHKGEAEGDTIVDYWGQGASVGDSIVLEGYAAGTTFTRVGGGSSTTWEINDHGYIEHVTVIATGQVHPTDVTYIP
jgi:Ca2+-binding RTX toxin-like protein